MDRIQLLILSIMKHFTVYGNIKALSSDDLSDIANEHLGAENRQAAAITDHTRNHSSEQVRLA